MVTKMSAPGRSFGGVADYCLHDRWVPGQGHPESAERVEWTETRNLATEHGNRAAEGSLKALIVSHRDGQLHVHVIANRVEPGKRQGGGSHGKRSRRRGKDRSGNEWLGSGRRSARNGSGFSGGGGRSSGNWRDGARGVWSELYGRQERQREQLAKDCHGVLGRFRAELEHRQRWERVSLGKAHSEAMREIDGEQAYEKMRRAMEKARQVERSSKLPARKSRSAVDRSGTMAPAAEEGRVSSEECGPNATRGLAESVRLDGVNAGGFRQDL